MIGTKIITDLKTILMELHYSFQWLDYGLLSNDFWHIQYLKYQMSDDKHTEHYRFEAFQFLLRDRKTLDEMTTNQYIELAITDIDQLMGGAALALLLGCPCLTDEQLHYLGGLPAYNKPFLQKLHQRLVLLRDLDLNGVNDESFKKFFVSNDPKVHRALLSKPGLKSEHLELIRDRGANKAIRNIARQKLQKY